MEVIVFGFFGWLAMVVCTTLVAEAKGFAALGFFFFALLVAPLAFLTALGLPDRRLRLAIESRLPPVTPPRA